MLDDVVAQCQNIHKAQEVIKELQTKCSIYDADVDKAFELRDNLRKCFPTTDKLYMNTYERAGNASYYAQLLNGLDMRRENYKGFFSALKDVKKALKKLYKERKAVLKRVIKEL